MTYITFYYRERCACRRIKSVDFHCDGRFPGGHGFSRFPCELGPGSKAPAIPLGVVVSIPINGNPCKKYMYAPNRINTFTFITTAC